MSSIVGRSLDRQQRSAVGEQWTDRADRPGPQRSALGIDANHDSADAEIVAQRLHPDGAEVTLCVNFRVCAVVVGV